MNWHKLLNVAAPVGAIGFSVAVFGPQISFVYRNGTAWRAVDIGATVAA